MMKVKKLFLKIISMSLVFASIFSIMSGCKKKNPETNEKEHTYEQPIYGGEPVGTHINQAVKTDTFIVKDGKSDYKIVVGKNGTIAAQYLQKYIKEATGCYISACTEDAVTNYGAKSKYIFVGENKFDKAAEISYTLDELGTQGFKIKSVGTNYFLGAVYQRGVEYAVFELLHHLVGFEQYGTNYTHYDRSSNVPYYKLNVHEVPDYEWRLNSNGSFSSEQLVSLRMNTAQDIWMRKIDAEGTQISWVHNSLQYLPVEKYMATHPSWYSHTGALAAQLCYTARGDKAEYDAMVDAAFETVKKLVIYNPNLNVMTFVHQDTSTMCTCDACNAEEQKYGTKSAAVVKFVNALGRKLKTWIAESGEVDKDRKVTLYMMAYLGTNHAPTYKDENGNYLPIDDDVVFEDNVGIWLAYSRADYTNGITEPENQTDYDNSEGWTVLTDKVILWLYQTYFNQYWFPHATWGTYQELYRYFYDKGAKVMLHQGQYNNPGSTAFNDLKVYLSCKLAWNVNLDEKTLTENYFNHVYGPAAGTMKMYFDEINAQLEVIRSILGIDLKWITTKMAENKDSFPYPLVQRWLEYFEVAYSQLETIADTDPEVYEQQRKMVLMESIFPRYLNVSWYSDNHSLETLNALRRSFVEDARYVRVNYYSEGTTLDSIIGAWQF